MFLTQTSVFLCVQCPVKILLSPEAGLHVQKLVVIFFFSLEVSYVLIEAAFITYLSHHGCNSTCM